MRFFQLIILTLLLGFSCNKTNHDSSIKSQLFDPLKRELKNDVFNDNYYDWNTKDLEYQLKLVYYKEGMMDKKFAGGIVEEPVNDNEFDVVLDFSLNNFSLLNEENSRNELEEEIYSFLKNEISSELNIHFEDVYVNKIIWGDFIQYEEDDSKEFRKFQRENPGYANGLIPVKTQNSILHWVIVW